MNDLSPKRRDLIVNYLSDISKGFRIAIFADIATGKRKPRYAVAYC